MRKTATALSLILTGFAATAAYAENFDLVIANGRVMDPETGFDQVANVGVNNGVITAITTDAIEGARTIDATGHVVAPGFIDGHVHVVDSPFGQKAALRDGLTTALDLESGAYPVDLWYDNLDGTSQLNYGATVSGAAARTFTFDPLYVSDKGNIIPDVFAGKVTSFDWSTRIVTDEERAKVFDVVEEGLKRGALGIGMPVGYMINGTTTIDMIGMQKLAAEYNSFTHIHTRFSSQAPPASAMLGFMEIMDPASTYGGGTIIAHFTGQALGVTEPAMEYVDDVNDAGAAVQLEMYPYNFGSAGTGISADYLQIDNLTRNMGRTYEDIIDTQTGETLTKETYEKYLREEPHRPVMFYHVTEEDMYKALSNPEVIIGCDCFPASDPETGALVTDWDTPWDKANTHPRGSGTRGIMLRLQREGKIDLTLMQAISKMSYQWAAFLEEHGVEQMARKGRLQVGADADITVFDPETVTDNSTLELGKNALPTTGIPYVIVNGTVVVDDSVVQRVFPGKPIRNPIIE
ncbi:amidohydrolase family protein [Ruegeria profundi]|uniref:Aminoacylase n=1 Tax=Ruegeria profundi TaxID=1685378 RepID=A0A0X3TXH0_9RHOB|nr:amidohydrolase family protein [Ruegeria profundi]KUJ79246.1 hypothetical protein AVO44_08385 [Ruegeria profundi]